MNAPHWSDRWANAADLAARLDRCVDRAPIVRTAEAILLDQRCNTDRSAWRRYADDLRDQAKLVAERYGAYDDAEALTDAADALDELAGVRIGPEGLEPAYDDGMPDLPPQDGTHDYPGPITHVTASYRVVDSSVIAGVAVTEHATPSWEAGSNDNDPAATEHRHAPGCTISDPAICGCGTPAPLGCDGCDGAGCSQCTDDDGCPL